MSSIPRGQALIMNIEEFQNPQKNRRGSEIDKTSMETLLRDKLHFEVKVTKNDLNLQVISTGSQSFQR